MTILKIIFSGDKGVQQVSCRDCQKTWSYEICLQQYPNDEDDEDIDVEIDEIHKYDHEDYVEAD